MAKYGVALTPWQRSAMINTIQALKVSALTHYRHGVKTKTLFDAFVREEHKDALATLNEICDLDYGYQNFKYSQTLKGIEIEQLKTDVVAEFNIRINTNSTFKFPFPKYMAKAKLHSAAPELEEAFRLIASINLEWARVFDVLDKLYNVCKSPREMKTICPHFPALLQTSSDEQVAEWGLKLAGARPVELLPAMSPEFRNVALVVGQTITKGLLIPKESEVPQDEFAIELYDYKAKRPFYDA